MLEVLLSLQESDTEKKKNAVPKNLFPPNDNRVPTCASATIFRPQVQINLWPYF